MLVRVLLIVPVALLVWWFGYQHARPDADNWITWLMWSDAGLTRKAVWGLISFAGCVAIAGSLALFARRSTIACVALVGVSYLFANFIGTGFRSSGSPMELQSFMTLALGMSASYPIVFSKMVAGKQVDIVGDEQ